MKKICLVNECDFGNVIGSENLGLLYLEASMRNLFWDVKMINLFCDNVNDIIESNPDIIGISVMTENAKYLLDTMGLIKKKYLKDVPIIIGGPGVTAEAEGIMYDYDFVNVAIIGEGDITLPEVCTSLSESKDLSTVEGIIYRKNNTLVHTNSRSLVANLDELPYLSHRDFKETKNSLFKSISMMSSRGCCGSCTFCYNPYRKQPGAKIRFQTPARFIEELQYLYNNLNCRRFQIIDQTFEDFGIAGKERIRSIAELIIEKKLNIISTMHIRTENWNEKDEEIIKLLWQAGFISVFPGIEAGTDIGLIRYNKLARVDDHLRTIELFRKNNFLIDYGFINFNPYITLDELNYNIKFLKDAKLAYFAHVLYSKVIVYPNTGLEKQLIKDKLLLEENVSYKNINNIVQYRFKDQRIEKIFNTFFITDVLKEYIDFTNNLYVELKDIMFWSSVLYNKLYKYSILQEQIKTFKKLKDDLFDKLQETNINRFSKYVELALDGWNSQALEEINSTFSYDYLDKYKKELSILKIRILHAVHSNHINDVKGILTH